MCCLIFMLFSDEPIGCESYLSCIVRPEDLYLKLS